MAEAEVLSLSKCRELLAAGALGRVGICTAEGPVILPVNYGVVSESVVFRTTSDGLVARHLDSGPMALEVDHVDYERHRGWSVLAVGPAEAVLDRSDLEQIRRTWEPRPWAGGDRSLHVRIRWEHLTGRRLGTGWTYAEESPVRRWLGPTSDR